MKYQLQKDFALWKKWEILTTDSDWIWYNSLERTWEHIDVILALPEIYKPIDFGDWIDKVIESIYKKNNSWPNWDYPEDIRWFIKEFMPKTCITNKEISHMKHHNTLTVKTLLQLIEARGLLKD